MDDIKKPPQDAQPASLPVVEPPASSQEDKTAEKPVAPRLEKPENSLPAAETANKQKQAVTANHEGEHHLVPVILAIIVLVFLVAVAIIADKNKSINDNTPPASTVNTQQTDNQNAPGEGQQTVNDAIKAINSLPAGDDTSGQSLSDQNLGL